MKRLRHYNKELAIVLSVFGSSEANAMQQYITLQENIKREIGTDVEIRLAISSRTIMKKLEQQGNMYLTLPEQLANLDRLGYKRVVVCSVNIFPTAEHEYICQVVESFTKISKAKYEITVPLFTKAHKTNEFITFLNNKLRVENPNSYILYIAHGAVNLCSPGNQTFLYIRDFIKLINPKNFLFTIEGPFPYDKAFVFDQIEKEKAAIEFKPELFIVPLLLVAGNHYKNDIIEMKEELSKSYSSVSIPEFKSDKGLFSLLQLEEVHKYFIDEIKESIEKIKW